MSDIMILNIYEYLYWWLGESIMKMFIYLIGGKDVWFYIFLSRDVYF